MYVLGVGVAMTVDCALRRLRRNRAVESAETT